MAEGMAGQPEPQDRQVAEDKQIASDGRMLGLHADSPLRKDGPFRLGRTTGVICQSSELEQDEFQPREAVRKPHCERIRSPEPSAGTANGLPCGPVPSLPACARLEHGSDSMFSGLSMSSGGGLLSAAASATLLHAQPQAAPMDPRFSNT